MISGQPIEAFWDCTWRSLNIAIGAHNERVVQQHNRMAWAAHTTAGLQRSKRMPPLKSLLAKPDSGRRRLSEAETDRFLISLAKSQGAKIVYNESRING